jgi:transposase InsO family protein
MMPMQGSLSIERMCELTRVSRASFYRSFREQRPIEEEMEVRSAIQQVAVEHRRRYGYRRISAELRRRGMRVIAVTTKRRNRRWSPKTLPATKPAATASKTTMTMPPNVVPAIAKASLNL